MTSRDAAGHVSGDFILSTPRGPVLVDVRESRVTNQEGIKQALRRSDVVIGADIVTATDGSGALFLAIAEHITWFHLPLSPCDLPLRRLMTHQHWVIISFAPDHADGGRLSKPEVWAVSMGLFNAFNPAGVPSEATDLERDFIASILRKGSCSVCAKGEKLEPFLALLQQVFPGVGFVVNDGPRNADGTRARDKCDFEMWSIIYSPHFTEAQSMRCQAAVIERLQGSIKILGNVRYHAWSDY